MLWYKRDALLDKRGAETLQKQPNPLIYYLFIYLVFTIVVGHLAFRYMYSLVPHTIG